MQGEETNWNTYMGICITKFLIILLPHVFIFRDSTCGSSFDSEEPRKNIIQSNPIPVCPPVLSGLPGSGHSADPPVPMWLR